MDAPTPFFQTALGFVFRQPQPASFAALRLSPRDTPFDEIRIFDLSICASGCILKSKVVRRGSNNPKFLRRGARFGSKSGCGGGFRHSAILPWARALASLSRLRPKGFAGDNAPLHQIAESSKFSGLDDLCGYGGNLWSLQMFYQLGASAGTDLRPQRRAESHERLSKRSDRSGRGRRLAIATANRQRTPGRRMDGAGSGNRPGRTRGATGKGEGRPARYRHPARGRNNRLERRRSISGFQR
jgi:hypothetical protein